MNAMMPFKLPLKFFFGFCSVIKFKKKILNDSRKKPFLKRHLMPGVIKIKCPHLEPETFFKLIQTESTQTIYDFYMHSANNLYIYIQCYL